MHPWGQWPVEAAILLWSTLRPSGVVTWHCREKCIHRFVEVILVRTELKWWSMEKDSIWGHMVRFPSTGGDVELSGAENKYIQHAWTTTGNSYSGCSCPAVGHYGVSSCLCFVEKRTAAKWVTWRNHYLTICSFLWPGVTDSILMSNGWLVSYIQSKFIVIIPIMAVNKNQL